jgi:signal transduction histidine kinase
MDGATAGAAQRGTPVSRILQSLAEARDRAPLWSQLLGELVELTGAGAARIVRTGASEALAEHGQPDEQAPSVVVQRLSASGKIYGVLALYFPSPEGLAEQHSEVIRECALVAGMVLQAEALEEDVSRFVHGATHDLRGHIVRASNFCEMLARGELTEDQRKLSDIIVQNLLDAEALLRGLTAYADAGSRYEAPTRFSIADAVDTARWNQKKAIDAGGAKVGFEGADMAIRAGQASLVDVLGRLIENSVKFAGPNAEVRISAKTVPGAVEITVADNGAGFDPQYLDSLFKPFQRMHGRQYPGHGLGLAICHRIVEGMGGRLAADLGGRGARVVITLPES